MHVHFGEKPKESQSLIISYVLQFVLQMSNKIFVGDTGFVKMRRAVGFQSLNSFKKGLSCPMMKCGCKNGE